MSAILHTKERTPEPIPLGRELACRASRSRFEAGGSDFSAGNNIPQLTENRLTTEPETFRFLQ